LNPSSRQVIDDLTLIADITVGVNKKLGCNLMEYPKILNISFADKLRYEERFEMLKKAHTREWQYRFIVRE
jgi:hypothetical protein